MDWHNAQRYVRTVKIWLDETQLISIDNPSWKLAVSGATAQLLIRHLDGVLFTTAYDTLEK